MRDRAAAWTLAALLVAAPVAAQQRPLQTQDPAALEAGKMMIDLGVTHLRNQQYPVSGLTGHLTVVPNVGLTFGLGGVAEIQIDNISNQRLQITDRQPEYPGTPPLLFDDDVTSDWADIVIGAKARILAEGERRPAIGFHFSTKLPNASVESGLGLDTFDFHNSLLAGKTYGRVRLVGNVGYGILADPTALAAQNDVALYGVSGVVRVTDRIDALAEVHGRSNRRTERVPPGTESSSFVRAGVRYAFGSVRLDGAVIIGLYDIDPDIGGTFGLSWVLDGPPAD